MTEVDRLRVVYELQDQQYRTGLDRMRSATRATNSEIIAQAQTERAGGVQVLVARMNKNKKFQKEQLAQQGYTDIKEFYENPIQD